LPASETIAVYVHGIGAHPPKDVWKGEWDLALFGKGMGERTRAAYWADILHPPSEWRPKALGGKPSGKLDVGQVLADAGVDPDNEEAQAFVHDLVDSVAGGGRLTRSRTVGKRVIPLPEFLRNPISEAVLRWFVKDTAAYFFDAEVRRQIQQRLIDEIPSRGEPFVLVTHSQGTIISFEVLSEMRLQDRAVVAQYVTLGSPLGLQEVQDQLRKRGLECKVPTGVRLWDNFADRLDPVALDRTLADDFAPRGGVSIKDHLIVNQRLRERRGVNPHDSVGYLSHRDVRAVVHRAMRFDTAGRFVIARDVAERFAARAERQPVLIEVLEPHYGAVDESTKELEQRELKQKEKQRTLAGRVSELANDVRTIVKQLNPEDNPREAVSAAKVQELRKYVAAHLTPNEIERLASQHAELNVYAIWRSARKRKLLTRSHLPLSADAARASYGADGKGVTWAVFDTGCRWDHPHFQIDGTAPTVLDCTTDDSRPVRLNNPKAGDLDGHGTHVAGILAGQGEQAGRVYAGVAPRAKLLVYKVLDDQGNGEDAWIIKAIDDVFRRNENASGIVVHGVNLSLGGPFDASVYGCGFSPICKELRDLWRQGVLVCVAAGNEGQIQVPTPDGAFDLHTLLSVGDPANLEDCIAVGSVNSDKPHLYGVSFFSSRGPTADGRMKPDVVAPGERIFSCNADFKPDGAGAKALYREDSGTSMACPHVSGLLAAFLSVRPEFKGRPDEVKRILLANCNDLSRDRYHQGAGVPNLMKMLMNT